MICILRGSRDGTQQEGERSINGKSGKIFAGAVCRGWTAGRSLPGGPAGGSEMAGTECCRVNFAGQQPGAAVIGGKDGPTLIYCSTEYDPDRFKKFGKALAAAAGGLLLLAVLLRKTRK